MASNIPDETLHEVLSHAVRVYSFTHNLEFGGPYGSHSPTTNALLVCKRWLRVATPVFYQYVRVANAKQMQKLAQTLRAHPQLGLMIRGLYLSGGYGINLYAVARHAPNIQDLFICPNMTSKDSNAGFLRALSLLKPKRLHVGCENGPSRSVKVQQLRQALLRGVQEWTTLEHLYLPDHHSARAWLDALKNIVGLKVLSVDEDNIWSYASSVELVMKLDKLECRGETQLWSSSWDLVQSRASEEVKERVVWRARGSVSEMKIAMIQATARRLAEEAAAQ